MPNDSSKLEKSEKSEPFIEQIKDGGKKLVLSFGPVGLALGLAIYFARLGQWQPAGVCFVGAGVLVIGSKFYKTLEPEIDKLFQWLVNNFVSWLKKIWWKITSNFQGKYYQQLIFDCRDYRTQGLKTRGAFTLDLEQVFVPLQVAPESADKISSDMMRKKRSHHSLGIWDFLAEISQQPSYRRIVIIGPPGSGKTTLLEHLTLMYAQNAQQKQNRKAPTLIPILLHLRTVQDKISGDNPPILAALIEQQPDIAVLNPKQWFAEKLKQGKCLVMFDGLDEVADEAQRQKVSHWIDQQMRTYSRSAFLLTSRPVGYRNAPLELVGTVLEMQQFSLRQTRQFIQNWYLQNEIKGRLGRIDEGVRQVAKTQADDLMNRIQNQLTLAMMALNPLLLTMIATVHRFRGALPGRRVELYGEICDVLLGRRQEAKGIQDLLTAPQKQSVLQGLALALMQQPTREFTAEQGGKFFGEKLRMVIGEAIQPADFLKAIVNQTGLLVEREQGIYEFVHKSFQEYLAAVEVKDTKQETLLTQKMGDDWWFETIRLYAAQSDASLLIWAALKQATVPALTLAVDCLEEGLRVKPEIRTALEQRLERGLESTNTKISNLAAQVKLARRLNRLLRIDASLEIDTTLITCAEYQLFINAQCKTGRNRQPGHWTGYQFAPGDAAKPISGVRASDAEAFCQWLLEQGYGFCRLPQVKEACAHPIADGKIGYWCTSSDIKKKIEGISQEQIQVWKREMVEKFSIDRDLARDLALDLNSNLARGLSPALDRDRTLARDLNLDLDLNLDREGDIVLEIALEIDRHRAINRDRIHDRRRTLDRALDLTLDRALDLTFDLDLDLRPDRKASETVCGHLLLIAAFWNLLSQIFERASQYLVRRGIFNRKRYKMYSHEYASNRDTVLGLYVFFVLINLRKTSHMPAWEGIRVVRERLTEQS